MRNWKELLCIAAACGLLLTLACAAVNPMNRKAYCAGNLKRLYTYARMYQDEGTLWCGEFRYEASTDFATTQVVI